MLGRYRIPVHELVPFAFDRQIEGGFQLNVKVGEVVRPEHIVASGWQKSGFRTFMLGELFKVPAHKTGDFLLKTIGTRIYKGDLLAQHSEFFGLRTKVFRSPLNGVVSEFDKRSGRLTLQYLPNELRVTSGVYGKVIEIVPDEHVRIATQVSLVKGVVGFGTDREGSLVGIGYPDIPLLPDHIVPKHKGKIIFGGTDVAFDTLYKALSLGVKGVITGGVQYTDYLRLIGSRGRFEDIGISLIVVEGFGNVTMNSEVYALLKKAENKQVFIDVKSTSLIVPGLIEEVQVDTLSATNLYVPTDELQYKEIVPGMRVRILTERQFGEYGIVTEVQPEAEAVTIAVSSGTITEQLANIEIVSLSVEKGQK